MVSPVCVRVLRALGTCAPLQTEPVKPIPIMHWTAGYPRPEPSEGKQSEQIRCELMLFLTVK